MLQAINLAEKLGAFSDHWNPRIIAQYNGNEIRVAKIAGEFSWHSHADTDELFLVLSGELVIDLRDGEIRLSPGEMAVIPRGTEHRPRAASEAHILLIDREGASNTGDQPSQFTRATLQRI
ncbi:cupin domain-containing protein [Novosphingobium lentum]|uniref:cupin domain-containing protein n=1 Tax=Novosphingobium lentum TaxID=145287 RepID=UPI00082C9272|nr:cupin domain-containing protein [Novosphingobium lentum]